MSTRKTKSKSRRSVRPNPPEVETTVPPPIPIGTAEVPATKSRRGSAGQKSPRTILKKSPKKKNQQNVKFSDQIAVPESNYEYILFNIYPFTHTVDPLILNSEKLKDDAIIAFNLLYVIYRSRATKPLEKPGFLYYLTDELDASIGNQDISPADLERALEAVTELAPEEDPVFDSAALEVVKNRFGALVYLPDVTGGLIATRALREALEAEDFYFSQLFGSFRTTFNIDQLYQVYQDKYYTYDLMSGADGRKRRNQLSLVEFGLAFTGIEQLLPPKDGKAVQSLVQYIAQADLPGSAAPPTSTARESPTSTSGTTRKRGRARK